MKKLSVLYLFLAFSCHCGFGKEVTPDVARQAGTRFYHERINQFRHVDAAQVRSLDYHTRMAGGKAVYYVFNMEPGGFVVVSADDAVTPVLAYSFTGRFSVENSPSSCVAWMKQYEDQVADAQSRHLQAPESVERLWAIYGDGNLGTEREAGRLSPAGHGSRKAVAPLIVSNWAQGVPYNEQCPPDPAGPAGHTIVGCVPVCLGQLMYYYRWPQSGTGTYAYYDSTYGTISADFGATTYEWGNMTNTATESNAGIARLLFHLGVSCDLVYGPLSSGMYNHKAAYALRTFFKYSPQTQYLFRDSTTLNWDSILIAHLDRRMPLYYAGWSDPNISGHAFVCDGYQDTAYFHFNFGWNGQNNGYYYTGQLIVGGNNFQLAQEMIINAYPDTLNYTYPPYCSGTNHLTYRSGSLDDGSGPANNYQPHSSCTWLIDPQPANDSVSSITLTFNNISTNPGDQVAVYDGGTEGAPLLGSYSGDTVPAPITGTQNRMFIKFSGDMGPGAPGWFATYRSKIPAWCTGTTTIKADTAVISDGSFGFDYHNSTLCKWMLQTTDSTPLTIRFRRFDTEPGKDVLSFYDLGTNQKLADVSGHFSEGNLPDSITAPGGRMMMIFMTNASVTGPGWEIYYPESHLGSTELQPVELTDLVPNPATGTVSIGYSLARQSRVTFTATGMTGTSTVLGNAVGITGRNHYQADISGLPPGIYLLRIRSDRETGYGKLVIR